MLRTAFVGAILSSVLFGCLDAYYLTIERRYVTLYEKVAKTAPKEIDFSMDTHPARPFAGWIKTSLRPHLWVFYGTIVLGEAIGLGLVKGK